MKKVVLLVTLLGLGCALVAVVFLRPNFRAVADGVTISAKPSASEAKPDPKKAVSTKSTALDTKRADNTSPQVPGRTTSGAATASALRTNGAQDSRPTSRSSVSSGHGQGSADRNSGAISPGHPAMSSLRETAEQGSSMYFQVKDTDPAVKERVLQLAADEHAEDISIREEAAQQGLSKEDTAKLRNEAFARYKKQIVDILGEQDGNYFLDLYASSSFVPLAREFAEKCTAQGEPLDTKTVASIAINLRQNLLNPDFPHPDLRTTDGIPVNESRAFGQAEKVLTPAQLALFKQYWSEHPYPKLPGR